jgi:GDP-L-fucose synthase
VKDFAEAVRRAIDAGMNELEPVNLAQNRGHSVKELVDVLQQMTGYGGKIVYNTKFGDGAPKKVMHDGLFRQRFPDFRFTPLADGLRETLAYYQRIL